MQKFTFFSMLVMQKKKKKKKRNCLQKFTFFMGDGRVVRWCWVNLQCRGVLLIWISVGQGPTALAVGAGWVVWMFFLSSIISLSFLPLSGRRPDID